MTDQATELKVTAASDIEVDREELDASITNFAGVNGSYYIGAFHKIHGRHRIAAQHLQPVGRGAGPALGRLARDLGHVLDLPHPRSDRLGADRPGLVGQSRRRHGRPRRTAGRACAGIAGQGSGGDRSGRYRPLQQACQQHSGRRRQKHWNRPVLLRRKPSASCSPVSCCC